MEREALVENPEKSQENKTKVEQLEANIRDQLQDFYKLKQTSEYPLLYTPNINDFGVQVWRDILSSAIAQQLAQHTWKVERCSIDDATKVDPIVPSISFRNPSWRQVDKFTPIANRPRTQ
jgi:hypothetical protein